MQHDDGMNALAPLFVGKADYGDVLDQRMSADQRLDFGWVDVLAARDYHVALRVGEVDVALGIATGHVADRAIISAERFLRLFRQPPEAIEVGCVAREQFAGFSIRYLS